MPKFDSPIGSRNIRGPQMKDVDVPDESVGMSQRPYPAQVRPNRDHAAPVFDEAALRDFQSQMQPPVQAPRELTQVELDILAAKKAKREGKERLSDGARRRIEMLLGMTRLTRDVEIAGQMYKLQTLTSEELRDAVVATSEFDNSVQFIFENRRQLLARSLVVVAGLEIDQFLGSSDLEVKLDFIERMDHALLLRLFNEYNSLAKEAQDKYSPKTDAQVKEVVEDLKK